MAELAKQSFDLGLVTADADAMLAFYVDGLGLTDLGEMSAPDATIRFLKCGKSLIKLYAPDDPPDGPVAGPGIAAGLGFRYLTLTVTDVAEVVAACARVGAEIVTPPTHTEMGATVAIVRDPEGNHVEIVST